MPEKKGERTIEIEAVNEIRAAHGRLLRCIERPPGKFSTAAIMRDVEDLDEAEYLLRCALARMGVEVRGRKVRVWTAARS